MSQHNDILKFEIAAGIQDGLTVERTIHRIKAILETLEWDEVWGVEVPSDCLAVAYWMKTQKDGLYGVTHQQLQDCMDGLTKQYGLNPVGFN